MAKGLLQPENKRMLKEVGNEYFDDLLSSTFLQHPYGNYFIMHDLISDLAKFIPGEFCVRLEDNASPNIMSKTRHFSYMKAKIS
ncbi:hypothetical protein RchiOBHm_Chr4g0387391 [Rosa chinensis]|uniref:Disease resistance protein winged helix domain-containing protein n=1 Tax=Rosa chinensis TaxID=74649 RepID=A0A2P6QPF7_ROSCH|nr:hypothetical protein RchiOBHm_Chr4g0387391 [Rosa chinensis]